MMLERKIIEITPGRWTIGLASLFVKNSVILHSTMSDSDIWSEIDEEELLQIEDEQTPKDIVVKGLSAPVDFPFPFTPYDIQKKLMEALYTALEGAKIGIFESPTGTGKSLSIICSTLKWLHDFEEQKMKELKELVSKPILPPLETNSKASDLPDWMQEFAAKHSAEQTIKQRKVEREAILRKEKKLLELKENLISLPAVKKFKATNCTAKDVSSDFAQIMASASDEIREAYEAEAAEVDDEFLLTQGQQEADVDREDSSDDIHVTKIYYCSRTHSQLSQFVSEIKKSPYADNCRVISLGSRQNMCINPSVLGLKSLSIINDRCKELQKSKSVSCSCPYYNAGRIATLANACLSTVSDIEDIVRRGRKLKACPYYAARKGIPAAQVVALPYNTLLHHSTREASGIHVKDNVVVIDEAHNLLETISNMYSVLISLLALEQCSEQLGEYKTKYLTRFLPQTLRHINLLMHVVDQLCKALQSNKGGEDSAASRLITVNDFLASCCLDHINFFPLLQFCKTSHVSRKLSGFANHRPKIEKETNCQKSGISSLLQTMTSSKDEVAEAHAQESTQQPKKTHVTSPMYQLEALLEALTNPDKDARVVLSHAISEGEDNSTLRYLLLNPALYFSQIVKEARSVIIAGGTMQPVSEFTEQLLHANDSIRGRIVEFSCDHVIPSSQVLPFAVYGDSRGRKLDFTFHSRTKPETLESLASVLCEACEVIPHGVVCFLPSYEYEALMFNYLEKSNWLSKINKFKEVFREPKSSSQLDNILKNYSRSAQRSASSGSNCGAILFSVVGGKMSEGINFSDDLGRCVVMVGLPYPNLFSPELKEKMKYLDQNMKKSTNGPSPGQVHYENLCMKAVNQSIGRAIRHRFDYACMLLLDCRYQRDSIISKLPNWLKSSVRKVEQIPKQTIRKFFLDQREMFKQ